MAWSAKLISGAGGTAGVNEFELMFDASTQADYKLQYGYSLGNEAPDVLYHQPDNAPPVPVRATGRNRLIFLTMHIDEQATWDEVLNLITPIARLVDGDSSQAIRAQTVGDVDAVKVAITPDGATYTTYFDVLEGFVDTSGALTSAQAQTNTMGYEVLIALTCKPLGYGDSFTLNNALASSPHFIEDSDSDGLADGWVTFGTVPPTETIDTSRYLTGGQSQKLAWPGGGGGPGIFASATVTATAGTNAIGYFWVSFDGAGGTVSLRLFSGGYSSVIDSVTVDPTAPAGYDMMRVDETGETWYRYTLSGSDGSNANFLLYIRNENTAATNVWVDNAYIATGTTAAPPAWSSPASIKNRYDPDVAEANINYLDVWGVPGDAPALVSLSVDEDGSSTITHFIIGRKEGAIEDSIFVIDDDDFFLTTSATGTGRQGGTASGIGTIPDYYSYAVVGFSSNYPEIYYSSWRVFALWKPSLSPAGKIKAGWTVTGDLTDPDTTTFIGDEVGGSGSNWTLSDMGTIPQTWKKSDGTPIPQGSLTIHSTVGSTANELDAVYLVPTDSFAVGSSRYFDLGDFVTNPANGLVQFSGGRVIDTLGGNSLKTLTPGSTLNRYTFHFYEESGADNLRPLSLGAEVTLTITPRTRHLLGTV